MMGVVLLAGCSSKPVDNVTKEPPTATTEQKEQQAIAEEVEQEVEKPMVEEKTNREIALAILDGMTLEEKIGQMFFARCPETDGAEVAAEYALGGYVLFGRDFQDKTFDEVVANIKSYQESVEIPMLIGVDEEGGTVVRVSKYPQFRTEPYKSPREIYLEGGLEAIDLNAREKSALLKELGINVNLAPVCDVSTNPQDYIYSRTLGEDAETTAEYTAVVTKATKESGIGTVLKHFPGYGNNVDTHTGVAYDKRTLEEFKENDFLPFVSAIEAGADSVLVSHNVMEDVDQSLPASLSPEVHYILRNDLGFKGVIMTDDTAMEGIKSFSDIDTAVLAVIAGNDLIISSNHAEQIAAVVTAVKTGGISLEKIDESVLRILLWKMELGIF